MMNKSYRILCIILSFVMILSLSACNKAGSAGNNSEGNGNASIGGKTDPEVAKQYVYQVTNIDLGKDVRNVNISAMTYVGDRIYLVAEDYSGSLARTIAPGGAVALPEVDEEMVVEPETGGDVVIEDDLNINGVMEVYTTPYYLVSVKMDGSDRKISKLTFEDFNGNGWMSGMRMLKDGSVVGMYEAYAEDNTDPENPIWRSNFYMLKWNSEGEQEWTLDLTREDGTYIYAQDFNVCDNGDIQLLTGMFEIITVDAQGNLLGIKEIDQDAISNMGMVITKDDNTKYVFSYSDNWTQMYITEFDMNTGLFGEKKELPGNFNIYSFYKGENADLFLTDSSGFYSYNIGDQEPTKILDYVNSDICTFSINNIKYINDQEFLATYYDNAENKNIIAKFTYVDPANIPDKEVLVLGYEYLGGDIRKKIIDFNKSNSQYRITLKDYNAYNTADDYTLGYMQMNNDIISGQMPDIMIIESSRDLGSWVNKGLLADVGELIANDPELGKLEYTDNVWKAFSVKDKLYTVISSFNVQTMVARKDMVGGKTAWTMTEFMDYMKTLPADVKPFGDDMVRSSVLYYIMMYCGSDFVDVNTGKCNFDSPEFIAMLEYANTFPEEMDASYWEDYDWEMMEGVYRDKKAVMMSCYISQIQYLTQTIHGSLGSEATFIGFPGMSGNSSVIQPGGNLFVLSAKSKNTDAAWQFVRQFLTEEYQTSDEVYCLPVLKSALEAQAKKATQKPYWINEETGEKIEEEYTYYINGEEIVLEPFSQAEVDEICDFIYSVDKRAYYNENILQIVDEEAQSYFQGQKSARDVAQIIQSRIQIYVDENQ